MREFEPTLLLAPRLTTDGGVTGAYVDMVGYLNMGGREVKLILISGAGTTAGTAGGTIQSAATTAGVGLTTIATFSTLTSAGGMNVQHGVIPASHRYVRFLGSLESGKSMILSVVLVGQSRVYP